MRFSLAIVALVGGGTACLFDSAPPVGASIACDDDGDCPAEQQCNLARLRCAPLGSDMTAPVIGNVAFSPAAVRGGLAALLIEVDEALALGSTPLVAPAPGSPALPFSAAAIDGARASLAFDTDDLAEGTYGVGRVEVQDAAGNSGARNVDDAWLIVDRTPPQLVNATIVELPAAGLSDLDGSNVLVVQFLASEPLAEGGATIALAGLTSECAVDDALRARCVLTIAPANALDGANTVTIAAHDDAGNEVVGTLTAFVDTAAPSIIPDSVELAITTSNGALAREAASNGFVTLTFIASEPLASTPIATIDVDGVAVPFALTATGNRYSGAALVPPGMPEGTWPVRVELTDPVGHASSPTLSLPSPYEAGVPFGPATISACAPPDLPVVCIDTDNDGFFAAGTCAGTDCNDLDPTVFPAAPELPGDGVANDCSTDDDAPIDESVGYFVDCTLPANGDGSRAAPVRTVVKAQELLNADPRPFLFLRGGDDDCGWVDGLPPVTVVGGLVVQGDGSWVRGSIDDRTRIAGTFAIVVEDGHAVEGIDGRFDRFDAGIFAVGPSVITRVSIQQLIEVASDVVVSQSSTGQLLVRPTGSARVSTTDVELLVVDGTASVHRGTIARVEVAGSLDVTSAAIVAPVGSSERLVSCYNCSHLGLFHTTLVRAADSTTPMIDGRVVGDMQVIASSFIDRRTAPFYELEVAGGTATIALEANNYGRRENTVPPPLLAVIDFTTFTPEEIDVPAVDELVSTDSSTFDPIAFDDGVHPGPASPLRDTARVALGYVDAPSSVMIDFDGECRYGDGVPDIGADEL